MVPELVNKMMKFGGFVAAQSLRTSVGQSRNWCAVWRWKEWQWWYSVLARQLHSSHYSVTRVRGCAPAVEQNKTLVAQIL